MTPSMSFALSASTASSTRCRMRASAMACSFPERAGLLSPAALRNSVSVMEEVAQRVDRAEAVLVGVRGLSHLVCVAVSARLAVLPEAQSPAPVHDRHRWTGPSPVPATMGHLSVVDRSVVTSATPSPTSKDFTNRALSSRQDEVPPVGYEGGQDEQYRGHGDAAVLRAPEVRKGGSYHRQHQTEGGQRRQPGQDPRQL